MLVDSYRHKGMRKSLVRMVQEKGIKNQQVLNALEQVPRHFFFEKAFLEQAYQDKAFPIGEGQTISQPYTVAYQTELLDIKPSDKILEVGTGSGYQCSILLQLTPNVYTIEFKEPLFHKAQKQFQLMGLAPKAFLGDGSEGLPAHAPFDKILVTAGAPIIPKALITQLSVGGKLVIPVGDTGLQKMLRITRLGPEEFTKEEFDNFKFVPLLGKQGWQ